MRRFCSPGRRLGEPLPAPAVRRRGPRPPASAELAVWDRDPASRSRAAAVAVRFGYRPVFSPRAEDLAARLAGDTPPAAALVGLPGGEPAFAAVAGLAGARPVMVASVAGEPEEAGSRAEACGADLVVVRPHTRDRLGPVLLAARRLERERERSHRLESAEARLKERIQSWGEADASTGFHQLEFFKRILVIELKRAKRYGYSLAACLVGLDAWPSDAERPSAEAWRVLRTQVASAISSCIRDIDLPVDYADDRFLVFLPYTDLAGAERVGERIAASVRRSATVTERGRPISASVSVGIAALRPGKPVSFARLVRDAGSALRAAQLKGGRRVVVRR